MGQISVFWHPARRRRWSDDELLQILAEAFSPRAWVAELCRPHYVSTALIYTWRRKLREASADPTPDTVPGSGFVEAVMLKDGGSVHPSMQPAMIVDLAGGKRISIFASASPTIVAATRTRPPLRTILPHARIPR